jgi:hypothetical protein
MTYNVCRVLAAPGMTAEQPAAFCDWAWYSVHLAQWHWLKHAIELCNICLALAHVAPAGKIQPFTRKALTRSIPFPGTLGNRRVTPCEGPT